MRGYGSLAMELALNEIPKRSIGKENSKGGCIYSVACSMEGASAVMLCTCVEAPGQIAGEDQYIISTARLSLYYNFDSHL